MRISDITNQFRLVLPRYTNRFSDILDVNSIIANSGTANIITNTPHGLNDNNDITIIKVNSRTPIASVFRDGLIFTFETSIGHDLTLNYPDYLYVNFDGFTDSNWNNEFKLIDVQNRKKFSVQSTNDTPILNGNEVLLEDRIDGIRGIYPITKINDTELIINGTFNDGIYSGGILNKKVRINTVVNIDRLQDMYTRQSPSDLWGYVIPHDIDVSKDRSTYSDATATLPFGSDMRLRVIDGFDFIISVPTKNENVAEIAIDLCRHDLFLPIMKTVYGLNIESGLSIPSDFRVILTGQRNAIYNKVTYFHSYIFEYQYDLSDSDTIEPIDTRAFRDINYTHEIGSDDTQNATADINLDDEPIIN